MFGHACAGVTQHLSTRGIVEPSTASFPSLKHRRPIRADHGPFSGDTCSGCASQRPWSADWSQGVVGSRGADPGVRTAIDAAAEHLNDVLDSRVVVEYAVACVGCAA